MARASPSEQGADGAAAAPPRWVGQVPDSDDILPDKDALADRIRLLVSDCKKAGIKQCAPVPKPALSPPALLDDGLPPSAHA